jgi:acyl-CoA thioester hydrolase
MHFFDDGFNPKFVFHSPVQTGELDARGFLPGSRFAGHVESAIAAWCNTALDNYVVRDMHIEFLSAVAGPTTLRIDLWVEELADDTCVYAFFVSSEDGRTLFARGSRSIRNVETSWTLPFRARHASLLKDLPAYA